ncbi:unnamed protein product [Amoebophrya sp. A120]|nr:unnamed protein product [Amoebophrya sp. A120]|eukprot:GSA120T00019489001.1
MWSAKSAAATFTLKKIRTATISPATRRKFSTTATASAKSHSKFVLASGRFSSSALTFTFSTSSHSHQRREVTTTATLNYYLRSVRNTISSTYAASVAAATNTGKTSSSTTSEDINTSENNYRSSSNYNFIHFPMANKETLDQMGQAQDKTTTADQAVAKHLLQESNTNSPSAPATTAGTSTKFSPSARTNNIVDVDSNAVLVPQTTSPSNRMVARGGCCGAPLVVEKNDNFKWHVPAVYEKIVGANPETFPLGYSGLRMTNSLTDEVEPFLPHEGRRVNWYVCGPTVYDHAHLGHARAYLTFDIMRRVMEDYFGYEVLYQLNITDIDDKIILRARKNELLAEYLKKQREGKFLAANGATFVQDVEKILSEKNDDYFRTKKEKLVAEIQQQIETAVAKGWKPPSEEEQQEKLEKFKLKQKTFLETAEKTRVALEKKDFEAAASVLGDELKDWLDETVGSAVTDNMVFQRHARKFEASFWDDMAALGVRPPDAITRVTEYVDQIVEFIKTMVASGGAYESNGSVYFDTKQFEKNDHDYPKLGPKGNKDKIDDEAMQEGEGALGVKLAVEKKDPRDFALWKKSKDGEPRWESPWGLGRPGWHIECSVMASDLMGDRLDIHGGGQDLKFPHHANEMAQSECYHGTQQWCNYWTHAGTLNIEGLKMSKSLKNFFSIKEILEKTTATQLRIAFLQQRWDRKMNYSSDQMLTAQEFDNRIRSFMGTVKQKIRNAGCPSATEQVWSDEEKQLSKMIQTSHAEIHEALLDNFNYPKVLQILSEMIKKCNVYMSSMETQQRSPRVLILRKAAALVTKYMKLFGVFAGSDELGENDASSGAGAVSKEELVAPFVDALVSFRDEVKQQAMSAKQKQTLDLCDDLRDKTLVKLGVELQDGKSMAAGATGSQGKWTLRDPNALMRERAQEQEKKLLVELKSLETKIGSKKKELERSKDALQYATKEAWLLAREDMTFTKERDEEGLPVASVNVDTKEETPLAKGTLKKLKQNVTKYLENRAKELKKLNVAADASPEAVATAVEEMGKAAEEEIKTLVEKKELKTKELDEILEAKED